MFRLLPEVSGQAFVVSLKFEATKRIYARGAVGVKLVPVPLAAVFQPPNVNPGLDIVPTVGRSAKGIAEILFVKT